MHPLQAFSVFIRRFVLISLLNCAMVASLAYSSGSQEPVKLLVLGDSLSAAYKLPVEQGWVALIEKRFGREGRNVSVTNASVSGLTTAGAKPILKRVLAETPPDYIVLELGANDGLQGKPIPYISRNLSEMITLSQNSGAKVMVLGVKLPPNRGRRYTEPFYIQFEHLVRQHGTGWIPFFMDGVAGEAELMMEDGLHPNTKGQVKIAANVYPYLLDWMALAGVKSTH